MASSRVAEPASGPKTPRKHHHEFPYWPGKLDDMGLDPYDLRVYLRIVRRAGAKGTCFESVQHMARGCRMSASRTAEAVRLLLEVELVSVVGKPRKGRIASYKPVVKDADQEWDLAEMQDRVESSERRRDNRRKAFPSRAKSKLRAV